MIELQGECAFNSEGESKLNEYGFRPSVGIMYSVKLIAYVVLEQHLDLEVTVLMPLGTSGSPMDAMGVDKLIRNALAH